MKTIAVWADTEGAPTTCRKCDAPIVFVRRTDSDKWTPFDGTRLVFVRTELDQVDTKPTRTIGYVDGASNHFATCPFAKEFRKRDK